MPDFRTVGAMVLLASGASIGAASGCGVAERDALFGDPDGESIDELVDAAKPLLCSNNSQCADGDPCTRDVCKNGKCQNPAITDKSTLCNDNNSCTTGDVCAPGGCKGQKLADGSSCEDGNACTKQDACSQGKCKAGPAVMCTAEDECHAAGVCNSLVGCSNPQLPDDTPCTVGTCQGGLCELGLATFPTGLNPLSLALGDFNNDNSLDLATANLGSNNVSVLLNNGSGAFSPSATVPVGIAPTSVAVGFFDAGGNLDLAVTNRSSSTVSILLGNGAGGFSSVGPFAVEAAPVALAVGDVNSDGNLDLAVACTNSQLVSILLGVGDGTFTPSPLALPFVGTGATDVALGRLDGDSILDLVLTSANTENTGVDNIEVRLGNGDGSFQPTSNSSAGANPVALVLADLENPPDGDLDIAIANKNGDDVTVMLNNGNATFMTLPAIAVGDQPNSVAVADHDGDGTLDLAVANGGGSTVTVLLGNGAGSFPNAQDFPANPLPFSVVAGDLNPVTDSKPDLAVGNNNSLHGSIVFNTTP